MDAIDDIPQKYVCVCERSSSNDLVLDHLGQRAWTRSVGAAEAQSPGCLSPPCRRESRASCSDLLPRPLALSRRRSLPSALVLPPPPSCPPSSSPVHAVCLIQLISRPPRGGLHVRPSFVVSPCSAPTARRRRLAVAPLRRYTASASLRHLHSSENEPLTAPLPPQRRLVQDVHHRASPVRSEIIVFNGTPPVSPRHGPLMRRMKP